MSKTAAIIYLPVRRHVRQFMLKEFGADPHRIDQRTYLGKQVAMVSEKLPYRIDRPTLQLDPLHRYGIVMPKALKHYTITEARRKELGDCMEKYFQDMLIMFVKGQVAVTQNELRSIKSFFEMYDLNPDDYDLEAGRKQYRDYKDRIMRHNGQMEQVYAPSLALLMTPKKPALAYAE